MPGVSPSLCAQGRSAYRLLLRSAAVAFKGAFQPSGFTNNNSILGDERVLNGAPISSPWGALKAYCA